MGGKNSKPDQTYYARNKKINKAINRNYTHTVITKPNYYFWGCESYDYQINGMLFESTDVIARKVAENKTDTPIQCIDVGAGNFRFVDKYNSQFQNKITCFGISASRWVVQHLDTDETHVFANAEHLFSVYGAQRFDLIFSRLTYMHFVDPLGAIIEAYNTLKPSGIMCIDQFSVHGYETYATQLIQYLLRSGHQLIASYNHKMKTIQPFILRKTEHELRFPLRFKAIENGKVIFAATDELLNVVNEEYSDYNKGRQIVLEAATSTYPDILSIVPDLPTLFANAEYQKLKVHEKYQCILAIVAKTITSFEMSEELLRESSDNNDDRDTAHIFEAIYTSNDAILKISMHLKSERYKDKIKLIQAAASRDILRVGQKNELVVMANTMGLVFTEIEPGNCGYPRKKGLEFHELAATQQPEQHKVTELPLTLFHTSSEANQSRELHSEQSKRVTH